MSAVADTIAAAPAANGTTASKPLSPNQRAWARFRRNRLGTWSLWIMVCLLIVSALAEVLSNDKPLVAVYDGRWSFPVFDNPPETAYGGDFATPTDWKDPFIAEQFAKPGNWKIGTLEPSPKRARPGRSRPT